MSFLDNKIIDIGNEMTQKHFVNVWSQINQIKGVIYTLLNLLVAVARQLS